LIHYLFVVAAHNLYKAIFSILVQASNTKSFGCANNSLENQEPDLAYNRTAVVFYPMNMPGFDAMRFPG
jgi:hypothetical protein